MRRLFPFILGILCLEGCSRHTEVAVVVDPATYQQISEAVDGYVSAISTRQRKGTLLIDRWGVPDSLRAELQRRHRDNRLEGAVLIGDIPIPMIRDAQHLCTAFKMDQSWPWQRSSVPSDRFYDDFGLEFEFLKRDEKDSLLYYYSLAPDSEQRVSCDIYSARIKAPMGPDRYSQTADFLRRAAERHLSAAQPMDKVLFYSGHGYNSDSMNARIDEAGALKEHLPFLSRPQGGLEYINHDFDRFVAPRLLSALDDPDLDLALLHHHGATDTQYMNGSPYASAPDAWTELLQRYFRGKVRDSRDPAATRASFRSRYGITDAWMDDSPEKAASDSIYYESMDIHFSDIDSHSPQAAVVMLDACFNGAFVKDDYVAAHYIFHPQGGTMAVRANSVNTLQDIWPDEQCGLLALGVSVGNWAKGEVTLENHVFGDPTFAFASSGGLPVDRFITMKSRRPGVWRRLLRGDDAELRCLAIKKLYDLRKISPSELLEIQKNDPSAIVRLEAFNTLCFVRDASLPEAITTAMGDSYELTRRLGCKIAAKNLSPELLPVLIDRYFDPCCTVRELFHIKDALEGMDCKTVLDAFEARPYWKGGETAAAVTRSLCYADSSRRADYNALLQGELNLKRSKNAIRVERNDCTPSSADILLKIVQDEAADAELRITAAEVLGWYNYSYRRDEILERCSALASGAGDGGLAAELRKTVNRLKAEY